MKDSILKGTGNSRFLKSAIPDGTTWAEALAMLRAGTFPMDLNGINNAGFQQVGTPLNKANLLKDVNALTLGLTGDAVPDDMFNILAHAGDLHVWKKTVFEPAGYHLGTAEKGFIVSATAYNSGNVIVSFTTSDTISVDSNGVVTQDSPSGDQFFVVAPGNVAAIQAKIRGKFVTEKTTVASGYYAEHPGLVYIPEDAILSCITNGVSLGYPYAYCYVVDKMQVVQSYPVNPVATYPVSTNRNAYQEGSDAKPAGDTLGATQKNVQILSGGDNWHTTLYYADSVTVDDEGKLSLQSPNSYTFATSSQYQNATTFAIGRFIKIVPESGSGFSFMDGIWFVPSDSTITVENFKLYASKIQPVTGYPAIPANTTIEYLGCLGDKTMFEIVSYIGTEAYGASNPTSLTFGRVPKFISYLGYKNNQNVWNSFSANSSNYYNSVLVEALTKEFSTNCGFGYSYRNGQVHGRRTGNRIEWYNDYSASNQFNTAGYTYYYIAYY